MPERKVHTGKIVPRPDVTVDSAIAALNTLVTAALDYGKVRQTEMAKRAAVSAAEHIEVERIHAAEGTLRQYFDEVFQERASQRAQMFERLDRALESGDPQMVHAVVRGIVEIAQSSPLSGVQEFGRFWAELGSPDTPVEL